MQQAGAQRDQDRRYALAQDERLNRVSQQSVDNARADERMGMERDRSMRANRLADLQYTELEQKAQREKALRESMERNWSTVYGPKKEVAADGTEIEVRPDPKDWRNQAKYFGMVAAEYAKVDPQAAAQLDTVRRQMEQNGLADAFRGMLVGNEDALRTVESHFNLKPGAKIVTERVGKDGPELSFLTGTTKSGNLFKQDLTVGAMAMGLNIDPNKGALETFKAQTDRDYKQGYVGALNARADAAAGRATSAADARFARIYDQVADNIRQTSVPFSDEFQPLGVQTPLQDPYTKGFATKYAGYAIRGNDASDPIQAAEIGMQAADKINQTALTRVKGRMYAGDLTPASTGKTWQQLSPEQRQRVYNNERAQIDRLMDPATAAQEQNKLIRAENESPRDRALARGN